MMPPLPETHRHLSFPALHPALAPYRDALEGVVKPAWLVRCQAVDSVSRFVTHVGGTTPYVPLDDGWPLCDGCGRPLEFIWQINFSEFQGHTFAGQGLFQFFYCWDCFPLPPDTDEGLACRWYSDINRSAAQAECPYQPRYKPFQVSIEPFLSVPGKFSPENPIPDDVQDEMVSPEDGRLWAVYSFTPEFYLEKELISRVGGYAPWVQFNDETPTCPACGNRAEFVAAIGSDDTDLLWGDSGYWYFFACKATPECQGLAAPLMASQCF
jgi:uncharacterized protein YwqG